MPAIGFWFSGAAAGAMIAVAVAAAALVGTGYAWYLAATNEETAARVASEKAALAKLRAEARAELGALLIEGQALLRNAPTR